MIFFSLVTNENIYFFKLKLEKKKFLNNKSNGVKVKIRIIVLLSKLVLKKVKIDKI